MILESPTNPALDYWLLVDPGETVGVRTIGAFLSFLVSPRCHGAALGTRSTQEKYCVLTLEGRRWTTPAGTRA
jgi:hypothetical protein